jgi:hypothetical protein
MRAPVAPPRCAGCDRLRLCHRDAASRLALLAQIPVAEYLLQQLKVPSFLGVITTGTMILVLLGLIDRSVHRLVAESSFDSDKGSKYCLRSAFFRTSGTG